MSGEVAEFRQRVVEAFGPNLEHATPATVQDFVDRLRKEQWRLRRARDVRDTGNIDPPVILSDCESPRSYEGVLREFFLECLDQADDHALIELWLFAFEIAYAGIEELDADRIGRLFGSQ